MLFPAGTAGAPGAIEVGPIQVAIDGEQRSPDIAWMQVQGEIALVRIAGLVGDTHAHALAMLAPLVDIIAVENHHIAAVAAKPIKIATGSGAVTERRHDLEEGIPDRHHHIVQAMLLDCRIPNADLQSKHIGQRPAHGLKVAGHQANLAQSKNHETPP